MEFAQKLDRLMKQRGQTQRSLAAALDLSHRAVGGWLSGSKPHRGTALLLAEYFQLPVEDLLDDSRALPLDRYAAGIREVSQRVQEAYPENPDAAMHAADYFLLQKTNREAARRLRKLADDLASIAGLLDGK